METTVIREEKIPIHGFGTAAQQQQQQPRTVPKRKKVLSEILLEHNLITQDNLSYAIEESKRTKVPLLQIIVDLGFVEKKNLLFTLSREWQVKAVDLSEIELDPDVVKIIPENMARRQNVIPFAKEENMLFVGISDVNDFFTVEDIRLRTGMEVIPYLALPRDIEEGLNKIYGKEALRKIISTVQATVSSPPQEIAITQEELQGERVDITEMDPNAPEVEKMVNAIFLGALEMSASDIHIEPFENKLVTRYRIDGVLQEAPFQPPYSWRNAIIAKIKILTQSMDITERRRPQDGRIRLLAGNRPIELRVNIIPTVFGESCVMRILDRSAIRVELEKLGFLPDTLEKFKASLKKPYGLILVSGPTGSGKSTTLYAALNMINSPEVKILTAENPVEYNLEGIVQVNINQEIGFDFASALRAFLRQDPDVIMVGEIRDKETATIAMEAAMTGHLVLSTIHTNDAPSAVGRLADMGVYPFLISSTLECVLAQRLVRRICPDCKVEAPINERILELFQQNNIDLRGVKLYRGRGCKNCNNTGLRGRIGIHELLVVDDELRALMLKEIATGPIRELALKKGMRPLFVDGLIKVAQGITTVEEVIRVSQQE